MLFGAVFTERDAISLKAECHEAVHCNQYQTLFATGFVISAIIALVCGLNDQAGWWMLLAVFDSCIFVLCMVSN